MLIIVFFFKQKTAYEMHISDWSSDVCSSDLEGRQEAFSSLAVQAGDALAQAGDGVHQVAALRLHADDLLVELAGLHLGAQVDRAHVVALADQASELGLYLLARRQLLALTDLRRLEHVVERAIELLAYSRHHRLEGLARLGHRALGADAVLAGIDRKSVV